MNLTLRLWLNTSVGFVTALGGVANVDAKALQEALVPQNANGRLGHVDVQQTDFGVGGVTHGLCSPLTDQLTREEIVGGEGHVSGVNRIERRVERDDNQACVASRLDRRRDRLGVRRHH